MENKKTYNEQLAERGTSAFLVARNITKQGQVRKAFVFVPADRAGALVDKLQLKTPADKLGGRFVCIRAGQVVLTLDPASGVCAVANYAGQTGRGVRLHEKLKESVQAYMADFHKGVAVQFSTDDDLVPMPDSFQKTGGAITLDDIMGL